MTWTLFDPATRATWPPNGWDENGDEIPGTAVLVLDRRRDGAPVIRTRWFSGWAASPLWWDPAGNDRSTTNDQGDGLHGPRWWAPMPTDLPAAAP